MPPRRRLDPAERRAELLDVAATLFAAKPYEDVRMEDVAERAGISRALLYRYFPNKRDLFAAIYVQASEQLLAKSEFDPDAPVTGQVAAALDAHLEYFEANSHTVLAANRELAGDQVIQAIIEGELATLRHRLLDNACFDERARDLVSAALTSWLVFVRTMCVDWLANQAYSREELRAVCLGALWGALAPVEGRG
ncbi:TetR/AcrR family transcriptional regulator [Allokutzneria multivorans]|uniref:TetR/AcrR family transcriptional regulator n=1 Tax=Allokutzneria multivorans TaxID=1142134 RepID=A0ABP7QUR3_9PSEU